MKMEFVKNCVVVIPAYNEAATIGDVIDKVPNFLYDGKVQIQVVVIDDGSSDDTVMIARSHGAVVFSNIINKGVGYSFGKGVETALSMGADYMVNIDADGQMDPRDIESVLRPVFEGQADMATASRFIDKNLIPDMPAIKRWGNKKVANIVSSICGSRYYDVSCGFRAYTKDVLLKLNLRGKYTYTQESFINLAMKDVCIVEVPLVIRGVREHGKSRVASNVLKYAIKSGSIMLGAMKSYKPKLLFGSIALITFMFGLIFELIFLVHYLKTGYFVGYLCFGITGGFLFIVSLFALMFMMFFDAQSRLLLNQEMIMYYEKNRYYYPREENNG